MERQFRLRQRKDFLRVLRRGHSWSSSGLSVRALPTCLGYPRFGFSVGLKVGTAVRRNKVKRWLREAVRSCPPVGSWDLVFQVRPRPEAGDYQEMKKAVVELLGRAGVKGREGLR